MVNKAIDILRIAKKNGIRITVNEQGGLQLKFVKGIHIEPELIQAIKDNKEEIAFFLNDKKWKAKKVYRVENLIKRFDRNSTEYIPLSFSQERLWYIDQLEGSVQYHLPAILRLNGNIDITALSNAFKTIVNRHEVLRTTFHQHDGRPFQHIKAYEPRLTASPNQANNDDWQMQITDGSAHLKDPASLHGFINDLVARPFDLSKDYMIRADLVILHQQECILVVTLHHIAADAWSLPIIIKELAELYSDFTTGHPWKEHPLPIQYADFSLWQRTYLRGDALDKKIAYWKNKLVGVEPLQLPSDFSRRLSRSAKGAVSEFEIDKDLTVRIKSLGNQHGASLFMTLLATFKLLLHRYSGQQNIAVGTSIAGRDNEEVANVVGFFVNTLALLTHIKPGMTFAHLLDQVKQTTTEAFDNQEVPFEKVVEMTVKERDPAYSPLFQVMLVLNNTPAIPKLKLGELQLSTEVADQNTAKFDLTFHISETENGLQGSVRYRTDLFKATTIVRMISHFKKLLSSIVELPQQPISFLPMLAGEERQLLETFSAPGSTYYPKDKTIIDLFEEQVLNTPEATAIVFEDQVLSYRSLNERANRLAHYLRGRGVKEGSLVPLCVERSLEMMIGLLGILKAGAAYVPMEPDFPEERKTFILEDTRALIVVSSTQSSYTVPAIGDVEILEIDDHFSPVSIQPVSNVQTSLRSDDLAYVIYTSGSTGTPKGVMIEHRNLVDYVFGLKEHLQIDQCRSYALVSSIATDLGNTVIYGSLVFGGALHLFSKESVSNIEYMHRYFGENQIDCLKIVPSHWKALKMEEELLLPSGLLVFGGEALSSALVEDIRERKPALRVINHYGPTETTIGKLLHVTEPGRMYNTTIPIGRPFSNTRVYVLSKDRELCPVGIGGELYIGGDGLARGYLNNEELTAQKFIGNPFADNGTPVLYRTGDMVRWLEDGNIEFIGRTDDQVKIRGYRVELGEIESLVQSGGLVSQVAVLAREEKSGNKRLMGYVVPLEDDDFDKERLISYLQERVPDYMVPGVWVELESFPLLPNGKVDKRSLPDPEVSEQSGGIYVAPVNETQTRMAVLWQDVLEVDQVGIHDNFFELGGHSLLAVRLISVIRKAFSVELPISEIFDYPTIALLCERVEQKRDTAVLPTIIPQQRPEHIPLSFSQERLWFIDQLQGSVQYHVPVIIHIKGNLDKNALEHSFRMLIHRHEVLRTVFLKEDGRAYQVIKDDIDWVLHVVDDEKYKQDEATLIGYIQQLISEPFDLTRDYMFRCHLVRLSEHENLLLLTIHHIAGDAWSSTIMVKDVIAGYRSYVKKQGIHYEPLPIQYADFAIWQRNYLQRETLDQKLKYWDNKLQNVIPLQLPTDYPRPPFWTGRGAIKRFTIEPEVTTRLHAISQQQEATLFMTLLAAFKILLYHYTGQRDICVGTAIAGRQHQELEQLVGFFINTLALRSDVNVELTFAQLLQQVKQTTLEAYQYQDVPFEKVVEQVIQQRDLSRNPLTQVQFVLRNTPQLGEIDLEGLRFEIKEVEHTVSKFDITFSITETGEGLSLSVEYASDLFREDSIIRMVNHYRQLLLSISQNFELGIDKLSLMNDEDRKLLHGFSPGEVDDFNDTSIIDLFEEQVNRSPKAIAVSFEGKSLTYKDLNDRSSQLASYLITKGVRSSSLVPICVERSFEMIVGILGILKAGAAYVPIDPAYPRERIRFVLEDTGASIVITSEQSRSKFDETEHCEIIDLNAIWPDVNKQPVSNTKNKVEPDQLAYVIYTSGSTGRPKGVMIEHRSLAASTRTRKEYYQDFGSVFLIPSFAFDSSVAVIFGTLATGGRLILCKDDDVKNPAVVKDLIEQSETFLCVPSYYRFLLQEGLVGGSALSKVIVAGEKLDAQLVSAHYSHTNHVQLFNEYGPTESTVWATVGAVKPGTEQVTIGKPLTNIAVYITDANLQLVPIGVPGELCIGGVQVARGYLNMPELTEEKFIQNIFSEKPGQRIYRTGDICRWHADGNIEYLGRRDEQVKIRGYRVELSEIEQSLLSLHDVTQAVVLAREKTPGNQQLVAYVVATNFDQQTIVGLLKEALPDYMIPTAWVRLDAMPLTANGKIDKRALPDPEMEDGGAVYVTPQTDIEIRLATIWQELLGIERVGVTDNFFELGGHSLLAMRMISIIEKEFLLSIPIRVVFRFTTIAELSKYLEIETAVYKEKQNATKFDLIDV